MPQEAPLLPRSSILIPTLSFSKMLLKSLAVSLLVVATVNAQVAVIPGYPPIDQVPDVNSPEVKRWLKQIDLRGAPKIPVNNGDPPTCPTVPFPPAER